MASVDILEQLNTFRTENEQLKAEVKSMGQVYNFENISGLDDLHKFQVTRNANDEYGNGTRENSEKVMSWRQILVVLSSVLNNGATYSSLTTTLKTYIRIEDKLAKSIEIDNANMTQIIFQLEALNLIRKEATVSPGTGNFSPRRETRYYHAELGRKIFLATKIIRNSD